MPTEEIPLPEEWDMVEFALMRGSVGGGLRWPNIQLYIRLERDTRIWYFMTMPLRNKLACLYRTFCLRIAIACSNIAKLVSLFQWKQILKKMGFLHVCFPEKTVLPSLYFYICYPLILGDMDTLKEWPGLSSTYVLFIYLFCHGGL